MYTLIIDLYKIFTELRGNNSTGTIVGGVLGIVLSLIIIFVVVLVLVLVMRFRNGEGKVIFAGSCLLIYLLLFTTGKGSGSIMLVVLFGKVCNVTNNAVFKFCLHHEFIASTFDHS